MPNNRNSISGISENWKVVVLAVAGAATFWLFNALNKNYDTRINYPLEFVFNRDSVIVVKPLVDEIRIDVNGGGWNLLRNALSLNSSSIKIELENPTTKKFYSQAGLVPIISDQLDGLKLNYVVTDTVYVNIEEKITKKVKVLVDSAAIPLEANHRVVSPIKFSLDSVIISGPKSLMSSSNQYIWVKFDEKEIDEKFDGNVALDLPGSGLITSNVGEVNLEFDVHKFVEHNLNVALELLHFPSNQKEYLTDTTVSLKFLVSERRIPELNASDFGISADYYMKDQADSTITPVITFYPDDIDNFVIEPSKLKVQYSN